ncbi:VOC family protein [Kribbella sp. NPDC051587]|jgi:predicted enzyme related to lactoylglutathione lyase|uniref:VOC family protein n=1 Tax=Kribbella sp. NPDC051587 TaxID=3364119 RepID=UPI00378F7E0D
MILRHITIDAENPYQLAQFWSTTTGWPLGEGDQPGDDEVLVVAPAPVPGLLFIRVPESKTVKNRVHIDWVPTERTRDEEVERLQEFGASIHEDHRTPEGPGWVTMLDPEQNEFCVERSEAERSA